jgi:hypothetical protein
VLAIGKYRGFATGEDLDLHLRLAENGRLANVPQVLLKYRSHASNLSKMTHVRERTQRDIREMVQDARQRRNLPAESLPLLYSPARTAADPLETWMWWALGAGYLRTARKHARRLLCSAPFSLHAWKAMYCALRGH